MLTLKKRRGVFLYRDYVTLLDDDVMAALMLSQIVYWCLPSQKTGGPKLQVRKWHPAVNHEVFWLAKSHQHWKEECGFSRKQTLRCLKVLKEFGLIETHVYRFNGSPVVHVRLLMMEGRPVIQKAPSAKRLQMYKVVNGPCENIDCHDEELALSPKDQFLTDRTAERTPRFCKAKTKAWREEFTSKSGEKDRDLDRDPDQDQKSNSDRDWEEESVKKKERSMTVAELLQQQKVEQLADHSHTSLSAFWLHHCAAVVDGYQKPLTGKERGQLKLLQNQLGPATREVIAWAVSHWQRFAGDAATDAGLGLDGYPKAPHIGFLLKYHATAVNLMLPKPTDVIPVLFDPASVPVTPVSEEEKPYVLSKAELDEFLASLKSSE